MNKAHGASVKTFKTFVREQVAADVDAAVSHAILNTLREVAMNKAHPSAPRYVRETQIPETAPTGSMRDGTPPNGLVMCLQTGDDVWRWWFIMGFNSYREAWCLESDQGGALEMACICKWIEPEKKNE